MKTNENKKNIVLDTILILAFMVFIGLIIWSVYFNKKETPKLDNIVTTTTTTTTTKPDSPYTEISYEQYLEIVKSGNQAVVIVGRETCPHCITYKSAISEVSKKIGDIFYYIELTEEYSKKLNIIATPTTILVKDGEVIEEQAGSLSADSLTELLVNNGFQKNTKKVEEI